MLVHVGALVIESPGDAWFAMSPDGPTRARMALIATIALVLAVALGVLRGRLRATSWLSATLDIGAAARAYHPTFVLIGVGDVFDIPVISPLARTGLSLEF